MPIKTPSFWYDENEKTHIAEHLLSPFSYLYNLGRKIDQAGKKPQKIEIPVICVGNITAGGSGKTPTTLALLNLIRKHNLFRSPHILTRGYGGSEKGPTLVSHHTAAEVGDEPLLLANNAPVVVSADRVKGAALAKDKGADIILMDDGFQNPSLIKDISILVIDGKTGFGNQKLLPAGPLREPVAEALKRAQIAVIIGEDKHNVSALIPQNIPIHTATIEVKTENLDKSKPVIAFAGLGRPEKFKNTLENNGFKIAGFYPYADHYPYKNADLEFMLLQTEKKRAALITTEKDIIRVPKQFREHVKTLPITLEFDEEDKLVEFLRNTICDMTKTDRTAAKTSL